MIHADQHVLEGRHVGKQADALEGARHAAMDDAMWRSAH